MRCCLLLRLLSRKRKENEFKEYFAIIVTNIFTDSSFSTQEKLQRKRNEKNEEVFTVLKIASIMSTLERQED